MRTLLIMTLLISSIFAHAADGQDRGGGYAYKDTTLKYLKKSLAKMNREIKYIENKKFNQIVGEYTNIAINKEEFRKVILSIDLAPTEERVRNNNNIQMPLTMDYAVNPKSIIALKPFFQLFNLLDTGTREHLDLVEYSIKRTIIHEATHTFGIGVNNDDVSYQLSEALVKELNIEETPYQCGQFRGAKNVEAQDRIDDCNRTYAGFSTLLKGSILTLTNKKVDFLFEDSDIANRYRDVHKRNVSGIRVSIIDTKKIINKVTSIGFIESIYKLSDIEKNCASLEIGQKKNFRRPTKEEAIDLLRKSSISFDEIIFYDFQKNKYFTINKDGVVKSILKKKRFGGNKIRFHHDEMICVADSI